MKITDEPTQKQLAEKAFMMKLANLHKRLEHRRAEGERKLEIIRNHKGISRP
jgi:hypothetical protein